MANPVRSAIVPGIALPTGPDLTLIEVLQGAAARHPRADAIKAPNRNPMSYEMLIEQVESARAHLHALGITRTSIVATIVPSGPEAAVVFLAVASLGIVTPLNPLSTEIEVVSWFERLRPALVVATRQTRHLVDAAARSLSIMVVELQPTADAPAGVFDFGPTLHHRAVDKTWPRADDIAVILPTSGTTGRSKLVPLTHRNVVSAARSTAIAHGLGPSDVRLNVMSLFHVQGLVGAVLASIVSGGSVVCASWFDPKRITRWLEECQATWFSASPTMHRELLRAISPADSRSITTRTPLRFVRSGSAALSSQLRAQLEDAFRVPVVESYGMTEAHQIASSPLDPELNRLGTVGRPTGCNLLIVDPNSEAQRRGEVGEIIIQGPNVISGYYEDADANRAAFLRGWLRTGDLGFVDADGYLTIVGRLKEIINRAGEKVSPREVEEAIALHPAVSDVAVFGFPNQLLGEDVVAAITLQPETKIDERDLRSFLRDRLAPSKLPGKVLFVDALPRGPTGKVQTRALRRLLEPLDAGGGSE